MPRLKLTDRFCQSAKTCDGEAQTDWFDEKQKGLALRVTKAGSRSWTYHFTLGGRRVRMTFGTYPATGLAKAHTIFEEARAALEPTPWPWKLATNSTLDVIRAPLWRSPRPCAASAKHGSPGRLALCAPATTARQRWSA